MSSVLVPKPLIVTSLLICITDLPSILNALEVRRFLPIKFNVLPAPKLSISELVFFTYLLKILILFSQIFLFKSGDEASELAC